MATRYYDSKAAELKDPIAQQNYKDSVKYLGVYSYQNCLETQIGLGLDLKGGMNVILEISVPDVLENLADHKTDAGFTNAMKEARAQEEANGGDFVSLFINAYHKSAPGHKLAEVFATQQLQGKVSPQSSDAEVEKAIRTSVQDAIDNSFNVVRTRIDKFGVVQPNIQKLEGQQGRIMVEMPGISQPERMRKMLQGSANLVAYLGNPRAISNGSRGQTAFFINEVIVVFLEDVFCRHIRATELGKFVAGLRLEHLEYQGREVLVSEECVSYTSVCLDRLHTLGEYPVAEFLIDKRVYVSDDALAGLLSIEIKSERTIDKAIAPLIHQLFGSQVTLLFNGLLIMALGDIMAREQTDKLRS